jgi:hypothetical protein
MNRLKFPLLEIFSTYIRSIFKKSRLKIGIYYRMLKESRTSYVTFGIGGMIIYGAFAILDIYLDEYIEFVTFRIRIAIISLCILVIPITRKKLTSKKIYALNTITFSILLLETEIQITGSVPFWEISTWFATVIFFLFCSFFFLGRPRIYIVFLLLFLIYYYSRSLFSLGKDIDNELKLEIISTYFYIFSTALLSFLLNIYWFRIRYTNLKNNHTAKINQVKINAMERDVAALQERENIFMDIHDHLGGKILECYLFLEELLKNQKFDAKQIKDIQEKLIQVRSSIRNRMQTIEEIDLISENLFLGLQYLINSRYTNANKKIELVFSESFSKFIKNLNPDLLYARNLYFLISELINNDLQYAISSSLWEFDSNNNEFEIKLSSKIQKVEFKGMGTQNILQRINSLNGTYIQSIEEDGKFCAKAVFPLGF